MLRTTAPVSRNAAASARVTGLKVPDRVTAGNVNDSHDRHPRSRGQKRWESHEGNQRIERCSARSVGQRHRDGTCYLRKQGETDAGESAQEPNDCQELQAYGNAWAGRHILEPPRSIPNPKRGPIDLMGILDGGIENKISDVVARTVRQRVAESPIPHRHSPCKLVPLLQLKPGSIIDGRSPSNMNTHGASPERQSQHRIRRPRQHPAQQPPVTTRRVVRFDATNSFFTDVCVLLSKRMFGHAF